MCKYIISYDAKDYTVKSRENDNIGYTRRRQETQIHNTICVGHHYAQSNSNNVNKTWVLLQTTGG
jgi:hypothetical protein